MTTTTACPDWCDRHTGTAHYTYVWRRDAATVAAAITPLHGPEVMATASPSGPSAWLTPAQAHAVARLVAPGDPDMGAALVRAAALLDGGGTDA